MIRAVLVDDERLAVERLERMLLREEGIEIVAAFTDPRQAIERLADLHPDVVFLDIEMPGVSGLVVARQICAMDQNIDVVFVTAFAQYAVDALDLKVLDYLLKPVSEEMLRKTIRRLINRHGVSGDTEGPVEPR